MKRLTTLFLLVPVAALAQSAATENAYAGNKAFAVGQFAEAIAAYRSAIAAKDTNLALPYNLGIALLQDKKPSEARAPLTEAASRAAKRGDKTTGSAAHYNLASSYLAERKWQEAVDAAKASLKKNPSDMDAKYNLSYALKHLKKGGGGGGDKKDKGGGEGQNKDESQNNEDKNKSKLSEQQAEQILDAVSGEEKDLQKKLRKGKGSPIGTGKDW